MPISLRRGSQVFDCSQGKVKAIGFDLRDVFDEEYCAELRQRHRDDEGLSVVAALMADETDTGFDQTRLKRHLQVDVPTEDWRIGETIAADVLEADLGFIIPWPTIRDLRNHAGSPVGTDHVGLSVDDAGGRFMFAEVKTSDDEARPPGVLHGRSGMVAQLLDLVDESVKAKTLVVYLGMRAEGRPWLGRYREAFRRWIKDANDLVLVGLMVRPMPHDVADLKARAQNLSKSTIAFDMRLYAVYVPGDLFARLRRDWAA